MLMVSVSERSFVSAPMDPPPNSDNVLRVQCRLSCSCGGATVEWRTSDGRPFPSGVVRTTVFSKRESTLMFRSISFDVAGEYLCIAMSKFEPNIVQETFTVDVLEPPVLTVSPSEITVPAGGDVTLVCEANRNVSVFRWTHQELETMEELPTSVTVLDTSTRSELMVRNIQRDVNTGQYFCQAIFDRTFERRSTTGNVLIMSEWTMKIVEITEYVLRLLIIFTC